MRMIREHMHLSLYININQIEIDDHSGGRLLHMRGRWLTARRKRDSRTTHWESLRSQRRYQGATVPHQIAHYSTKAGKIATICSKKAFSLAVAIQWGPYRARHFWADSYHSFCHFVAREASRPTWGENNRLLDPSTKDIEEGNSNRSNQTSPKKTNRYAQGKIHRNYHELYHPIQHQFGGEGRAHEATAYLQRLHKDSG